MDSLSQLALGASVGVAVMGRRTAPWKAALWGAACGTLPDLDAFIDHGDPVRNMVLHRADSHSLLYLSLLAPLLGGLAARLHGETDRWRRWVLALWLALVTHPLLDLMTVYGTQLLRPFTDHPYGVGSIFIIDPLYTLPLLVGLGVALRSHGARGLRWNAAGLAFSTLYLAWGFGAQQQVEAVARASLEAEGAQVQRLLVTPTAFNTVLWRVVAITPDGFLEGFHSLLDEAPRIAFERFPRGEALHEQWRDLPAVARLARFSHGFFKMDVEDGQLRIADLRMGQEPFYVFTFVVAREREGRMAPLPPEQLSLRPDFSRGLPWMWRRLLGEPVPTPR
ncbi:metal-dependent hydrolase [Caldimonas tepidiphila]|uniref:metal-dependent hydrolase n=1 Tax=Caldimonas tepidiphila TaxID=2315841 RepID=UPI000E5A2F0F|nr:metal-dependent hydrolase [Caldimonas tepidiphila]